MPVEWVFARYELGEGIIPGVPGRVLTLNQLGGIPASVVPWWDEAECGITPDGGAGWAMVRLNGTNAQNNSAVALPGVVTLPNRNWSLTTPLSTATANQRTFVINFLQTRLGYTPAETSTIDWATWTLADLLAFAGQRRRSARWTGTAFAFDGELQPVKQLWRQGIKAASGGANLAVPGAPRLYRPLSSEDFSRQSPHYKDIMRRLARGDIWPIAGGAFPTQGVIDNFNRGSLGTNWTTLLGTIDIVSSTVLGCSSAPGIGEYNVTTYGADSECYFTITTVPGTDQYVSALARMTTLSIATTDGYMVRVYKRTTTDEWEIHRIDNATATQLGATMTQEFAANDSVGIEVAGTTITAYFKTGGSWSAVGNRTDATYGAAGYLGAIFGDTTGRVDDFSGGTIGAGGGTIARQAMLRPWGIFG